MDQVFRHLQADVSTADHHRCLVLSTGIPRRCALQLNHFHPVQSTPGSPLHQVRSSPKDPGRSIPGKGGRIAPPRREHELVVFLVVTSPVTWFLSSTVFFLDEMPTPRSASDNRSRTSCERLFVDTRRLDSFSITPETW